MNETFFNILGVVYVHECTADGGELYFTAEGARKSRLLSIENWHEPEWFRAKRQQLTGTSTVFRVPTREVNGEHLELVVKTSRVGEDVPLDTQTLRECVDAEFNSPWEEFSLVSEMRESKYGPDSFKVLTQKPLAIYVPPGKLQLWQTGRSRSKINRIVRRHGGVHLDILRQYKLVYQWINGLDIVEAFEEIGFAGDDLQQALAPLTRKVIYDLSAKGFIIADMKPAHIIIAEDDIKQMRDLDGGDLRKKRARQHEYLNELVQAGAYSVIDYELLQRTKDYEEEVKHSRRHNYHDDQRDRFKPETLPLHLQQSDILGVPYVHGHVESTDGLLWVVGRNPRLYDYFLPERWRKTPCKPLSERSDVFYTLTKDNLHLVWKTSRVGELPAGESPRDAAIRERGFNSPFEEFAIASELTQAGVPCVYVRAIYMTGTERTESIADKRRFESHAGFSGYHGLPILREERDYISIRGFYNGPDSWVAVQEGPLLSPVDVERAIHYGVIAFEEGNRLLAITRHLLLDAGYDGSLLELNDIIISLDGESKIVMDNEGKPEVRICNFELLYRR